MEECGRRCQSIPESITSSRLDHSDAKLGGRRVRVHWNRSRLGQDDAPLAIPLCGIVTVTVVAKVRFFVMSREHARHSHHFLANSFSDRRRVVQYDGGGHDHVEGMIGEWQVFASAQEKLDVAFLCQETTSLVQLGRTEVDAD